MRFLIVSDIHSNQPALGAVLDDAAGRYDQILCLGDLVGYGPDPNSVTEWAQENDVSVVRGNHDRACTGDPVIEWFTGPAQFAALWTNAQLTPGNRNYLEKLPPGPVAVANIHMVHGSPKDEDEYILNKQDASHLFRYMPGEICFFGHTHLQGGFGLRKGRVWLTPPPAENERERCHQLEPDAVYLLNPGSVGQPRDTDPRAAYAIFDSESKVVAYRRVAYPVEETQARIRAAGLPHFLAERLATGR